MEKADPEKEGSHSMDCSTTIEDFLSTGRTGRRNAMPDILDSQNASVSTGALPFEMEKLSCSDDTKGTSNSAVAAGNTSSGQQS